MTDSFAIRTWNTILQSSFVQGHWEVTLFIFTVDGS